MTRPARVLIIEDEAVVQLHLKRLVEGLGFDVVAAEASGERALAAAEHGPPDLALVDINIEGSMDGISLAREIANRHQAAIVFVTAFADDDTLRRSRSAGAVGYVVKPFTEEQLRAVLTTAMAEHERLVDLRSREQSLASALTSVGEAVLLADYDGRVTFMNPLAERLTGWTAGDAQGRMLEDVVSIRDSEKSPFEKGAQPMPRRVEVMSRDGSKWTVLLEVRSLPATNDRHGTAVVMRTGAGDSALASEHERVRAHIDSKGDFQGMIGKSPAMLDVFFRIEQLAKIDWTVLIEGETGTGKELAARALHDLSPRRNGPFIAVNCAALTDTLLGSQLFGHRRGSFTGALDDHVGLFEAASGGTLFLDEIGDVSENVQTSLLRVLDERCVTRIGETISRPVDTRVVCASQRDLSAAVATGRFRADLMYRLRAARLSLPPLRHRGGDIDLLVARFLDRSIRATGKSVAEISDEAAEQLHLYRWPGNVRELRGAIDHAVLACRTPVVGLADLPAEILTIDPDDASLPVGERDRILEALRRCGGNRTRAAALLGISRATLYRRLSEFDLGDSADS